MHNEVKQVLCSFGCPLALHKALVCNNTLPDVIALLPHTRLFYVPSTKFFDFRNGRSPQTKYLRFISMSDFVLNETKRNIMGQAYAVSKTHTK